MKLGMIGLGRMGANMIQRLLEGGHQVVGYARRAESGKIGCRRSLCFGRIGFETGYDVA